MLDYIFYIPILQPAPKHGSPDSMAGRSFGICDGRGTRTGVPPLFSCQCHSTNSFVYHECYIINIIKASLNSTLIFISFSALLLLPTHCRCRGSLLHWSHTHTHTHTVDLLWAKYRSIAETSTWRHSQQTDIHALWGIRTRNLSKRAAAGIDKLVFLKVNCACSCWGYVSADSCVLGRAALLEWYWQGTKCLCQCHCIHDRFHMDLPRIAP